MDPSQTETAENAPLPETLAAMRADCRQQWAMPATEDPESFREVTLHGGPLDKEAVFWHRGENLWSGSWFKDDGTMILVRYELTGLADAEYAGEQSMTDLAYEVADIAFEGARDSATEAGAPELEGIDLETMSTDDALEFLLEDNERRVAEFKENTEGQVDLSDAFDITFVRVFLDHLVRHTSAKVYTEASLEFEDRRSRLLDKVEEQYVAQLKQREAAMAQARLMGQGGPPPGAMRPVAMPPRRIRRGN